MKKAADAANRRLCFVGMSLNTYLEAAHNEGMAPFDPRELIAVADLDAYDPSEVMIVTTGSQVTESSRTCIPLASHQDCELLGVWIQMHVTPMRVMIVNAGSQ